MIAQYDNVQRMFTMCWLSNEASSLVNSENRLQEIMADRLTTAFSSSHMQKLIGEWTVVWGPVVTSVPQEWQSVSTNAMFVARNHDSSQYVVAIAGTNSMSNYGWLVEDAAVDKTVEWPYDSPAGLWPRISLGTSKGLEILLAMKTKNHAAPGDSGAELTLLQFMTDQMNHSDQRVEWTITGYSLGGALSPVLSLLLAQQCDKWDEHRYADVTCTAFAGATPGNGDFARLYGDVMGSRTTRIWNARDVVPHAWDYNMLLQVPSLYMPHQSAGIVGALLVDAAKADSLLSLTTSNTPYLQLLPETPGLPGQVVLDMDKVTDHKMYTQIIKAVMDKVVDIALESIPHLPGFIKSGIENAIDATYAWLDAHTTVLDDLIDRVLSELNKIGEHHHLTWIGDVMERLLREVEEVCAFLQQMGHQHTTAYVQLLGVGAMHETLGQVLGTAEARAQLEERRLAGFLKKLDSLISVDFLHKLGHPIPG